MPSIKGGKVVIVDSDGDPIKISSNGKLETETNLDMTGATINATINDISVLPPGSMGSGKKICSTSAGTLGSGSCTKIDILSADTNTHDIYVGGAGVSSDGNGGGVRLRAGDFYSIDIDNLNDVHVVSVSGSPVITYNYYT